MKHIKFFEAYEVDDRIRYLINWKMIEDVKDMALEYIDNGLTLVIFIYYKSRLYELVYNHDIDSFKKLASFWSHDELRYLIELHIGEYETVINQTEELVDRVKEAYPNEKII